MKRVGIIGGMGPLATADLYMKIISQTPAKCDQEHIPLLIDSYPQIEDRTAFILGKGENPLPRLVESANRLKNAGCEAVCMPCNTAHFFAEDVKKQTGVKILHIAEITVEAILRDFSDAKNIAILATDGTIKAKIYENPLKNANLNPILPNLKMQNLLMDCIYKGVKAGKTAEFLSKFEEILQNTQADAYIAGCTEIPIFLPLIKSNKVFIDPTLELAKAVVKFAKS